MGSNATQSFTLTAVASPVITSAISTTFAAGTAGSFTVTTTGFPIPALTETVPLPAGVTFTDDQNGTATLSWTTAVTTGIYGLTITASNGVGANATQSFTLKATAATFYISSAIGSDSNTATQAQNKATPWAHLPGMVNCSANCASFAPVAGDQFILRGGDTWNSSSLGINWQWSGTSTLPIYIGVDPTWFAGSAWTRPVWTCGGAACQDRPPSQLL